MLKPLQKTGYFFTTIRFILQTYQCIFKTWLCFVIQNYNLILIKINIIEYLSQFD